MCMWRLKFDLIIILLTAKTGLLWAPTFWEHKQSTNNPEIFFHNLLLLPFYLDKAPSLCSHLVPQKICFIFGILQSSHRLPWWQFCTRLAFSQPASWGMLFKRSWKSSHICWALVGCFSFTLQSNSSQTISILSRFGDCGDQVIWCSTPSLSFLVK